MKSFDIAIYGSERNNEENDVDLLKIDTLIMNHAQCMTNPLPVTN